MNIDYYLTKEYSNPPCWEFVSDFYLRERGLQLENFTCENSPKEIAKAFRESIISYKHKFDNVSSPNNDCVVLCSKHSDGLVTHVGVFLDGSILHCDGSVHIDDLASFKIQYPCLSFYKLKETS